MTSSTNHPRRTEAAEAADTITAKANAGQLVRPGERASEAAMRLATEQPAKAPTKAQQARELTGPRTGVELEQLRSALLIAKQGAVRYYWPKSVWPTLEAAEAALRDAGARYHGLAFTQYRAAGPFQNLVELVAGYRGQA